MAQATFLTNTLKRAASKQTRSHSMPLSGEAIRTMNYVDDIATTLRRILTVLPSLTPEERKRVSEYIKASEPNYEQVQAAIEGSK
jgi:hypothetical protein